MVARLCGAGPPRMVLTVLTVYLPSSPRETAAFEQAVLTISTARKDFCFTKDKEVF